MNIKESVTNTLRIEGEALNEISDNFDANQIEQVVDAIFACRNAGGKVVTAGCGTSAAAARKISHTLCCVEFPAVFLEPSDAVHGGLGLVQANDVLILLSKGGKTDEINMLIAPAQQKKAKVVGVTENPNSLLAQKSDIFLKVKTSSEPDPFNMLATASILAVLAVFDAISIVLMQIGGFTKEQFALIHPHGAVGERLTSNEQ